MKNDKELVSGAVLSKRLGISPVYVSKKKQMLINGKCTRGNLFYFRKSALALGKDPDNVQSNLQHDLQKQVTEQKQIIEQKEEVKKNKEIVPKPKPKKTKPTKVISAKIEVEEPIENDNDKIRTLKKQIEDAVADEDNTKDSLFLNGLKTKAAILVEYQKGINEEIKNKKLTESLFSKDEVLGILTHLASSLRSSLLNLPNNYAVNLEGLTQKQIKEYVTDDINKILEQIQNTGDSFE